MPNPCWLECLVRLSLAIASCNQLSIKASFDQGKPLRPQDQKNGMRFHCTGPAEANFSWGHQINIHLLIEHTYLIN